MEKIGCIEWNQIGYSTIRKNYGKSELDMKKNGPTFKCGVQESGVKKANQETSLLLKLIISKTDEI